MSWSARFETPVKLPTGGLLSTLENARAYILKLPKADQHSEAWQAATQALLLTAEHDRPRTSPAWACCARFTPAASRCLIRPEKKDVWEDLNWRGSMKQPKDIADWHRVRRDRQKLGDGLVRATYVLSVEGARNKAREFLIRYPAAAYMSKVESWSELPDGRIEFTMCRLPTAD